MPDPIGPFRGPRQEGVDYFDDVLTDNAPGIFDGSDGAVDYDKIKSKKKPTNSYKWCAKLKKSNPRHRIFNNFPQLFSDKPETVAKPPSEESLLLLRQRRGLKN